MGFLYAAVCLTHVLGAAECNLMSSTPPELVRCALTQNPEVDRAKHEVEAAYGGRDAASVVLPSFPVLSLAAARRHSSSENMTAFMWEGELSQEIQIGGQRRARIDTAEATILAAKQRLALTQQQVAAEVLTTYADAVAAQQHITITEHVSEIASTLSILVQARVQQGTMTPVETDAALSEVAQLALTKAEAQRRYGEQLALLRVLLNIDVTHPLEVPSTLENIIDLTPETATLDELVTHALTIRGDLGAANAERTAAEHQLSLIRRTRVPNLTLSFFAGRDGFHELVVGGGVSLPLPVISSPFPGQIAEQSARLAQADNDIKAVRRRIQLEVASAYTSARAAREAAKVIVPELFERARAELLTLYDLVKIEKISVAEALVLQRNLIDLLQAYIELRRLHTTTWIELRRATALALPGVSP